MGASKQKIQMQRKTFEVIFSLKIKKEIRGKLKRNTSESGLNKTTTLVCKGQMLLFFPFYPIFPFFSPFVCFVDLVFFLPLEKKVNGIN